MFKADLQACLRKTVEIVGNLSAEHSAPSSLQNNCSNSFPYVRFETKNYI